MRVLGKSSMAPGGPSTPDGWDVAAHVPGEMQRHAIGDTRRRGRPMHTMHARV